MSNSSDLSEVQSLLALVRGFSAQRVPAPNDPEGRRTQMAVTLRKLEIRGGHSPKDPLVNDARAEDR